MTGAELKTLREGLGLPVAWSAAHFKVQERTIRYWESGRNAVPEDVAKFLTLLDNQFDLAAAGSLKIFDTTLPDALPRQVVMVRYRTDEDLWRYHQDFAALRLPTTAHAALLRRAVELFARRDVKLRLVYMEPAEYEAWLDGRAHTLDLSSEWSAARLD